MSRFRMPSGQLLSHMGMNIGVLSLFAVILMSVGSAILKPAEAEVS
ncbi:hypothetical protein [Paenibacillus pectinilyticus]|nr:hypothetical protein [Paenibacillus pectinilyticus]